MNKVYNRIESITGNVITVRAKGIRNNELATVNTRFGKSLAEVNKIRRRSRFPAGICRRARGVSTGDEVRSWDRKMRVSFSEDLLGGRQTDAVDVGQADFNALVARKVDTNKTCHRLYLLFLPSPDAAYGGGSRK